MSIFDKLTGNSWKQDPRYLHAQELRKLEDARVAANEAAGHLPYDPVKARQESGRIALLQEEYFANEAAYDEAAAAEQIELVLIEGEHRTMTRADEAAFEQTLAETESTKIAG